MKDKLAKFIKTIFKKENMLYLAFYALLFTCLVVLIALKAKLHPVVVSGASMSPTYTNGEFLATKPLEKGEIPEVGSVVVFARNDGKKLIKRVKAVPGDTIMIVDGVFYRNGEAVDDGFPAMEDPGWVLAQETVPENCIFVLGDNRNASSDSRIFGYINIDEIFGVVIGQITI